MKTMKKGLGMNKMLGGLKRRTTGLGSSSAENIPPPASQSPEEAAVTAVKRFCSSDNKTGDEVLFLPTIVDAAESSPAAAAECARVIRKYLARSYNLKPTYQYNAVMLVRILTENPGPTFTRNLDKKFAETVKELLKTGKDRSVLNLLMETLDEFEHTKVGDEGLTPLIEMWKKEKEKGYKNEFTGAQPPAQQTWRPSNNHHNTHFSNSSSHRPSRLPSPEELASRLEEASTSAKLLTQFVTSSTAQELLGSDLVREFASRCQSASKSIQGYMASEDPAPDNDTMESLLDINEQLQAALNAHQRAVLSAKKSLGISGGAGTPPVGAQEDPAASVSGALGDSNSAPSQAGSSRAPSVSRPRNNGKGREETPGKGKGAAGYEPPPGPPPGWDAHAEDPFRDPHGDANNQQQQGGSSYRGSEALVFDSFHPGFTNAGAVAGGSGSGSGYGLGYGARRPDDDDDDIYDSVPRR